MKLNKSIYATTLAIVTLMAGCSSDQPDGKFNLPEGSVTFRADMMAASRATETAFETGDHIGILAKSEAEDARWDINDVRDYVYDGTKFLPATEEQAIVKKENESVSYIAYYPYTANLMLLRKFAVKSDQSTHEAYTGSDFCASWTGALAEPEVNLTFYHCLSHVIINISGYNLAGEMTAQLRNVASEATLDLNSRKFEPTGTTADITMLNNGTLSYKAIVAPQVIAAGQDFIYVTINGKEFPVHSDSQLAFQSGREYVFNVKVVNGEVVGLDTVLMPWNTTEVSEEFAEDFFSIEEAEFHEEEMTGGETEPESFNVSVNESALAGGLNFIIIRTGETFKSFQVAAKGNSGYWECSPEKQDEEYRIPVLYGLGFSEDMTMNVVGVYPNGEKTPTYDCNVNYVESKIGDLNLNLTFSTPKDVDLHLYTPNGDHIYYGNRGGTVTINGVEYEYGLDHDSNAGCHLDYLNNENIFIPEAMIMPGEYIVKVDMYSNCNTSYDCQWSIAARYNGELIRNELTEYGNPASDVYAPNCDSGDYTTVMKFTLIQPGTNNRPSLDPKNMIIKPRKITEAERFKILDASYGD